MELRKISPSEILDEANYEWSPIARDAVTATISMYEKVGYREPWGGYLLHDGKEFLGTCSFKSPPSNGRVEIAYFTFPGFEGRGYASRMASDLIRIARNADPGIVVFAQTLPEEGPSTSILKKLGFVLLGEKGHSEDGIVWEWELKEG